MSSCNKQILCMYYTKSIPVDEVQYQLNLKKYCKGDYAQCARYIVFEKVGLFKMRNDLLPDQIGKANQICNGR